ncbi:unnamed protein product [Alternaria alternata]
MASLQERLAESSPLKHATKLAIINSLWPRHPPVQLDNAGHHDWKPYFDYYVNQCHHSLQGHPVAIRTHQDIVKISYLMRKNVSREDIEEILNNALETIDARSGEASVMDKRGKLEEKVHNTINLVARLYFMVNVGAPVTTFTPGRTKLQWTDNNPRSFLSHQFGSSKSLRDVTVRFEKAFTARNIERVAGITIHWTDNLADHLRMLDSDDKTVAIFHYASFLKHQAVPVFPPFFPSLYPTGFIEETLRTLALLFPQHDRESSMWLQSRSGPNSHGTNRELLKCGHLRLEERQQTNFNFWHDRLVILKQAYDESRPATLSQWWLDRRNTVQWYTFWVAIVVLFLTIFFGLVQSIEGALQVYKAGHESEYNIEMYERALQGYEEAFEPNHTSTLQMVNNLDHLYADQGRLGKAEEMFERALQGYEKAFGRDHPSTLDTVNNLGALYASQDKLDEAEEMYERALQGYKNRFGSDYPRCRSVQRALGML